MKKIRQNDEVVILTGKDKGRTGVVKSVLGERLLVEGCNLRVKHRKSDPARGVQGGIVNIEAPIHHSNVAIYNRESSKADRVGIVVGEDGKRKRVFKSDGKLLP